MQQIYRYLSAGLICAGVEYGSFAFAHHLLTWNLIASNAIAYGLALVCNFLLNRQWVFTKKEKQGLEIKTQIILYLLLVAFNYILSTGLLIYFVKILSASSWLAKAISMSIVIVWNFIIYKKIIYK